MNYDVCIKKSIEYIEDNLDSKIELQDLADKVFLSKYHFHRTFHAIVGEPVAEYIRNKRLMKAANELINTEDKLVDIAFRYQFSTQEAFTTAFKKLYGVPPREFRRTKANIIMMSPRKNISSQPTTMCMAA